MWGRAVSSHAVRAPMLYEPHWSATHNAQSATEVITSLPGGCCGPACPQGAVLDFFHREFGTMPEEPPDTIREQWMLGGLLCVLLLTAISVPPSDGCEVLHRS